MNTDNLPKCNTCKNLSKYDFCDVLQSKTMTYPSAEIEVYDPENFGCIFHKKKETDEEGTRK